MGYTVRSKSPQHSLETYRLQSSQNRQPIQVLEEARDAIQTLHVGHGFIMTGSVDEYVRTYDLRMGQLRTDYIGCKLHRLQPIMVLMIFTSTVPVTSVVPSQDGQTYLVTTLDSHVRLMDATTGKLLNDFSGHTVESYRCRSCFGFGEATVICGDEKGQVWAWDLLDVNITLILAVPLRLLIVILRPIRYNPVHHQRSTTK